MVNAVFVFQFMFSLAVFVRISNYFYENALVDKVTLTKFGTVFVVWSVFAVKISTYSMVFVFFWLQIPNFVLFLGRKPIILYREWVFRRNFILFLSQLLLEIRTGNSFRPSIAKVKKQFPREFRQKIDEILNIVVFSQHIKPSIHRGFLKEVVNLFTEMDITAHQSLKRGQNYLSQIKILENFRQRSGQIMLQVYLQSTVMAFLYLSVLGFVIYKFGYQQHQNEILVSLLLFILGFVWVLKIGRSFQWKL